MSRSGFQGQYSTRLHCKSPQQEEKHGPKKAGEKFGKTFNTWKSRACNEWWNDNDPHVGVECDTCCNRYHLECSSVQHKTKDYQKICLDSFEFESPQCKGLFDEC